MQLYQGIVVNNNDPDKVGKVQIRIPLLHGNGVSGRSISNEGLPWFEQCVPWYGGYQSGSFIVPPVGSILWCIVEEVKSGSNHYLYIGGCYGIGSKNTKKFGDQDVPLGELETPKEAVEGYPDSYVIFKSLSGATIYVSNDGSISLIKDNAQIVLTSDSIDITATTINLNGDVVINGDSFDY